MGFYKDGKWQPDAAEIASGEYMEPKSEIAILRERIAELEEELKRPPTARAATQYAAHIKRIAELEHKLVRHGHCPKCNGVYSRRASVGCLGCGYLEQENE
jgi:hypothetical protein